MSFFFSCLDQVRWIHYIILLFAGYIIYSFSNSILPRIIFFLCFILYMLYNLSSYFKHLKEFTCKQSFAHISSKTFSFIIFVNPPGHKNPGFYIIRNKDYDFNLAFFYYLISFITYQLSISILVSNSWIMLFVHTASYCFRMIAI